MLASTSSSRYSSSHWLIETIRQRPRNGDLGFDFSLAIVSLSASAIVAEPVAVIPDQIAVAGAGLVEFGQWHVERPLTAAGLAKQPFFLVQVVFSGAEESVDSQRRTICIGPRPERELQLGRQIVVVGQEGLPADLGERVVVG